MIKTFAALASGAIFGIGLTVSRMIDPAKVLGFLDLFGDWDPSLAFVMGGALVITVLSFSRITKRQSPLWHDTFHVPAISQIDARLFFGAALFGIGWGLVGLCPGPALANLLLGTWEIAVFVVAMVAGMALFGLVANAKET